MTGTSVYAPIYFFANEKSGFAWETNCFEYFRLFAQIFEKDFGLPGIRYSLLNIRNIVLL